MADTLKADALMADTLKADALMADTLKHQKRWRPRPPPLEPRASWAAGVEGRGRRADDRPAHRGRHAARAGAHV
eukprot:365145-Chlamydomonas_euryale.AAC.31